MTRIGLSAIALAIALAFAGVPAQAGSDPAMVALFEDCTFPAVDDAELAGEFGRGLASDSTASVDGPENRLAVILWDETKPPIVSDSSLGGGDQATGNVMISIGVGSGIGP